MVAMIASIVIFFHRLHAASIELRVHPKDSLSLPLANFVPGGLLLDDLTIAYDSSVAEVSLPSPSASTLKIPGEYAAEMANVVDSDVFRDKFVLLANNADGCQAFIGTSSPSHSQAEALPMVHMRLGNSDQDCKRVTMDHKYLYYTALSKTTRLLLFCSKSHSEPLEQPNCTSLGGDLDFSEEDPATLVPEILSANYADSFHFVLIYFPKARGRALRGAFMLVANENVEVFEVPIEEFRIGKIDLIGYRAEDQAFHILILNDKGRGKSEVFNVSFVSGKLNKDSLKYSMLKDGIETFDVYEDAVMLYENHGEKDSAGFQLTVLNLKTLSEHQLSFEGAFEFVRTVGSDGNFIVIQVNVLEKGESLVVIEVATGLAWKLGREFQSRDIALFPFLADGGSKLVILANGGDYLEVVDLKSKGDLAVGFKETARLAGSKTTVSLKVKERVINTFTIEFADFSQIIIDEKQRLASPVDYPDYVRLPVFGNAVDFGSGNVEYAAKLHFDAQALPSCEAAAVASLGSALALLCKDDSIRVVEVGPDSKSSFDKAQLTTLSFRLSWYKWTDVQDFAFLAENTLVAMTKSFELHYLKINDANAASPAEEHRFSKIKNLYEQCWMRQRAVLCLRGGRLKIFSVVKNAADVTLSEILQAPFEDTRIDQLLVRHTGKDFSLAALRKSPEDSFYYIEEISRGHRTKSSQRLSLGQDCEPKLVALNEHSFVVYAEAHSQLQIFVVHGNSVLKFPAEPFVRNFKEVVGLKSLANTDVFVLLYKTLEGQTRGVLYRAAVDPLARVHSEFGVSDDDCAAPLFSLSQRSALTVELFFICEDEQEHLEASSRGWSFRLNGAYAIVAPFENSLAVKINQGSHKFVCTQREGHPDLSIKTSGLYISANEDTAGWVTKKIEGSGMIELDGPVRRAALDGDLADAVLYERVTKVKEETLQESVRHSAMKAVPDVLVIRNSFMVIFDDLYFYDKKTERDFANGNCQAIAVAHAEGLRADQFKHFVLCRDKRERKFVLSNFSDISIKVDPAVIDPSSKFDGLFAVVLSESFYVFAKLYNSSFIKAIKVGFDLNANTWEIDQSAELDVGLVASGSLGVAAVQVFYDPQHSRVWICAQGDFSDKFSFLRFELESLHVAYEKSQQLALVVGSSTKSVLSSRFVISGGALSAIVQTDAAVHIVKFACERRWSYSVQETFEFFGSPNNGGVVMNANAAFLGVLRKKSAHRPHDEIYIYRRDSAAPVRPVYYIVEGPQVSDNDYSILNFAFKTDPVSEESTLLVVFEETAGAGLAAVKKLVMKEFYVGEMMLKIDVRSIAPMSRFTLAVTTVDGYTSSHAIDLTMQGILPRAAMLFILFALSVLLLGLLLCVVSIYRGNKVLRRQLDAGLRQPALE